MYEQKSIFLPGEGSLIFFFNKQTKKAWVGEQTWRRLLWLWGLEGCEEGGEVLSGSLLSPITPAPWLNDLCDGSQDRQHLSVLGVVGAEPLGQLVETDVGASTELEENF